MKTGTRSPEVKQQDIVWGLGVFDSLSDSVHNSMFSNSLHCLIAPNQHAASFNAMCDEWGGAESRGNGARPVELSWIMSGHCTTHRSRVPRRSSGRIKGGATTVEEERGPGLDFNLCFVCGSRP